MPTRTESATHCLVLLTPNATRGCGRWGISTPAPKSRVSSFPRGSAVLSSRCRLRQSRLVVSIAVRPKEAGSQSWRKALYSAGSKCCVNVVQHATAHLVSPSFRHQRPFLAPPITTLHAQSMEIQKVTIINSDNPSATPLNLLPHAFLIRKRI